LQKRVKLPVQFVDEKLSSWDACCQLGVRRWKKSDMRHRSIKVAIDANAAKIIVQTWLNSHLMR